ncbi:hypothetical protein HKX48_001223, partial [Thoreauomyces humboldtii]
MTTPTPSAALQSACGNGYIYEAYATYGITMPLANATAFCLEQFGLFATDVETATIAVATAECAVVANEVAVDFGGPGIILGTSIPFIVFNLMTCLLRIRKVRNTRAAFLLVATLGSIMFASSIAADCHDLYANYYASDVSGLLGIIILLIFIAMAGVTRFVQVIVRERARFYLQHGITAALLVYGCIITYVGQKEVYDAPSHPYRVSPMFVGLLYIPIATYFLGGIFGFSWNLPSAMPNKAGSRGSAAINTRSSQSSALKDIRIVNDVAMSTVMLLCLAELGVLIPLRTSVYNNSSICLISSLILFVENIFEKLIRAVRKAGQQRPNVVRSLPGTTPSHTSRGNQPVPSNVSQSKLPSSKDLLAAGGIRESARVIGADESVSRTELSVGQGEI